MDITHPFAFGLKDRSLPAWRTSNTLFGTSNNPYLTVTRYTQTPLLSGYVSKPNLKRLEGTVIVLVSGVGQGHGVLFADNPNIRGTWLRFDHVWKLRSDSLT